MARLNVLSYWLRLSGGEVVGKSLHCKLGMMLAAGLVTGLMAVDQTWAANDGPSFDCRKASLPDEKAICADPQLSAMDVLIADAFKQFEPAYGGDKRQMARTLVAERHACGSDANCIAIAQYDALQTFGMMPSWVQSYAEGLIGRKALEMGKQTPQDVDQPIPEKVGQCAVTRIAELTTRFGDPLDSASAADGSAVSFSNGGAQISYDQEPGLMASSAGDRAALCLMSIPRDCPPGDERGRLYYGLDLVTNASWVLPDSQHMCGGA
jgi:uncharacterized protein